MRPEVHLPVLLMLIGAVAVGHAETVLLSRDSVTLHPNVTMDFATEQRIGFVDHYTARITVLTVEERGEKATVRFRWRMFAASRHPGYDQSGEVTTTGLADGSALNGWWGAPKITTADTHLWLSRSACRELLATGQTHYVLDRVKRRDPPLLLQVTGTQKFPVEIDGKPREVPALTITSTRADRLVMMADCKNPLVLEIDAPKLYRARLTRVFTTPPR
jgi:hypothetical protein